MSLNVGGSGKVKAALTRKLGPLPAWAWALLLGAGVYYWRHRAAAAAASTGSGAGVSSGGGSGIGSSIDAGTGAGGGGGGDQGTSPFDALPAPFTQQGGPVTFDPAQSTGADTTPTDSTVPTDSTSSSSTNPTAPQKPAGATGALLWGGTQFRTRAKFVQWLNQHGATVKGFQKNHPAAYATFLRLPAGTPAKPKHATEKRPPTLASEHGKGGGFKVAQTKRPVSVRATPTRSHVETPPAPHAQPAPSRTSSPRATPTPKAKTAVRTLTPAQERSFDRAIGLPTFTVPPAKQAAKPAPKPAAPPARTVQPASAARGGIDQRAVAPHPAPPPPKPAPHAPPKQAAKAPPKPVSRIEPKARPR